MVLRGAAVAVAVVVVVVVWRREWLCVISCPSDADSTATTPGWGRGGGVDDCDDECDDVVVVVAQCGMCRSATCLLNRLIQ